MRSMRIWVAIFRVRKYVATTMTASQIRVAGRSEMRSQAYHTTSKLVSREM